MRAQVILLSSAEDQEIATTKQPDTGQGVSWTTGSGPANAGHEMIGISI